MVGSDPTRRIRAKHAFSGHVRETMMQLQRYPEAVYCQIRACGGVGRAREIWTIAAIVKWALLIHVRGGVEVAHDDMWPSPKLLQKVLNLLPAKICIVRVVLKVDIDEPDSS